MNTTLVLYHANCNDGFTAAWVAHRYYLSEADYLACNYGDTPDVSGYDFILMLDICLPVAMLDQWVADGKRLLVIDHHKTAKEMLEGKDYAIFSMGESGASLAWEHFFPHDPRPPLVKYVRDRDLWLNALPGTEEITEWLWLQDKTFESYTNAHLTLLDFFPVAIAGGEVALKVKKNFVDSMVKKARFIDFLGYSNVPMVNTPAYAVSDVLHKLSAQSPVGFAVAWWQEADKFQYSFRAQKDGPDVALLAQQLGGGGHKSAAGARVPKLVHDINI